jgi:hypothetical protein
MALADEAYRGNGSLRAFLEGQGPQNRGSQARPSADDSHQECSTTWPDHERQDQVIWIARFWYSVPWRGGFPLMGYMPG